MINLRTFAKTIIALGLVAGSVAFAQTGATTTVATTNTIDVGTALLFETTSAGTVSAADSITFDSNDGKTYKITVAAKAVWDFLPATGAATTTSVYPVLKFVNATGVTGGSAGTANDGLELITSGNALAVTPAEADVVTGITSASGGATVNYSVDVGQKVVAGEYNTTLTYSFVATP